MIVDLIGDYFTEYPAMSGASDKVDTDEADEVLAAIAKTVSVDDICRGARPIGGGERPSGRVLRTGHLAGEPLQCQCCRVEGSRRYRTIATASWPVSPIALLVESTGPALDRTLFSAAAAA